MQLTQIRREKTQIFYLLKLKQCLIILSWQENKDKDLQSLQKKELLGGKEIRNWMGMTQALLLGQLKLTINADHEWSLHAYFKYKQTASTLKSLVIYDRWNFGEKKMHVKLNSGRDLICLFSPELFSVQGSTVSAGVNCHFRSGPVYIFIYTKSLVNGYVTIPSIIVSILINIAEV